MGRARIRLEHRLLGASRLKSDSAACCRTAAAPDASRGCVRGDPRPTSRSRRSDRRNGLGARSEGNSFRFADYAVPSIAALSGHAIGAGLCLAITCDLRVMHRDAKVGMTFVKLGTHPGMAATWNLPRLLGPDARGGSPLHGQAAGRRGGARARPGRSRAAAGDDFEMCRSSFSAADIAANGPVAIFACSSRRRARRSIARSRRQSHARLPRRPRRSAPRTRAKGSPHDGAAHAELPRTLTLTLTPTPTPSRRISGRRVDRSRRSSSRPTRPSCLGP